MEEGYAPVDPAARQAVIVALAKSVSSTPSQLEEARLQLDEWHRDQGFWKVLLDVCFDQALEIPHEFLQAAELADPRLYEAKRTALRTAGVIRFKNGADKFWRLRVISGSATSISDGNKAELRSMLLRVVQEPERGVALQATVTIARIARTDFPNAWPDLFDRLHQTIIDAHARLAQLAPQGRLQAENEAAARLQMLRLMRAVDIVQRTLKELETVRVLAGKIRMTELADKLLPTLQPMFAHYFAEIFPSSGGPAEGTSAWASAPLRQEQIRTCHLFLKAVSRLVVSDSGTLGRNLNGPRGDGATPDAVNLAQAFFRTLPQLMQSLCNVRIAFVRAAREGQLAVGSDQQQRLTVGLTKHLLAFGKLLLALLNRQNSKAAQWEGWSEVVWWYWGQISQHANSSAEPSETITDPSALLDTPSRFIIQGLVLLQLSLTKWKDFPQSAGGLQSPDFAQPAIEVLVGKLMRLSKDDLAEWEADPEQWSVAESQKQEQYELEIRTAAERALMTLAAVVKPTYTVSRSVWRLFDMSASLSTSSLQDVLTRDAIYAAVGRLRDHLPVKMPGYVAEPDEEEEEKYDLSTTISSRLIQEAAIQTGADASWVIIRRRIAWLIWEWSEHVSAEHRAATYTLLVELLADKPGVTDIAVRLAAARSLGALADALEFDPEAFTPFLQPALSRLATLAASPDLQEMSSVKICTEALSVLIERLGPRIGEHIPVLASLVPPLWATPDPEFKAKPSILVFVTNIVKAVELLTGPQMDAMLEPLHSIVAELIRSSLDKASALYLMSDALTLWARAVHSAPKMTAPLFALLDLVPELLPQAEETPQMCRIVEEYALITPKEAVMHHGRPLFAAFAQILSEPSSPVIMPPLATLDLMQQSLVAADASNAALWASIMQEGQVFALLLGSSLRVKESMIITSNFVATLARTIHVLEPDQVISLLQSTAPLLGFSESQIGSDIIAPLIRLWCNTFESIGSVRKRRVTFLGLAALVKACGQAQAATQEMAQGACLCIAEMAAVWSDALGELREHTGEAQTPYLRSLTSTEGLGAGPLDTDEDNWLEDTSPGSARLKALAEGDAIVSLNVPAYISSALTSIQQRFPGLLEAALSSMDPLVLDILMKDLNPQ